MSHSDTAREPLTVLADRYAVIKQDVAARLRARQEATRFGAAPTDDDGEPPPGKQDARKIAAHRLGEGVSHTTLEKVLWLRRVAFDLERRGSLRREAMDAWEEIGAGEPVNWLYERVRALVLIDDLEQLIADSPTDSVAKIVAERELKVLRSRGVAGVTSAMRRRTREALAAAECLDRDIDEAAQHIGAAWRELEAALKRRESERKAAWDQKLADRLKTLSETPLDGGANR
ncbi:MAG: hypothetical protein LBO20_08560 [Bifidobacteriaceae bacterium]|jgi:hypothetical protein|nr:hypothetical protein [Bifidobacteriaceae bacterium]